MHCEFFEQQNSGYYQFQSTFNSTKYVSVYKGGKAKKQKIDCSKFIKVKPTDDQIEKAKAALTTTSTMAPTTTPRMRHHGHHNNHHTHHNSHHSASHRGPQEIQAGETKLVMRYENSSSASSPLSATGSPKKKTTRKRKQKNGGIGLGNKGGARGNQNRAQQRHQQQQQPDEQQRALRHQSEMQQERAKLKRQKARASPLSLIDEYSNDDNMISDEVRNRSSREHEMLSLAKHKRHQKEKEFLHKMQLRHQDQPTISNKRSSAGSSLFAGYSLEETTMPQPQRQKGGPDPWHLLPAALHKVSTIGNSDFRFSHSDSIKQDKAASGGQDRSRNNNNKYNKSVGKHNNNNNHNNNYNKNNDKNKNIRTMSNNNKSSKNSRANHHHHPSIKSDNFDT